MGRGYGFISVTKISAILNYRTQLILNQSLEKGLWLHAIEEDRDHIIITGRDHIGDHALAKMGVQYSFTDPIIRRNNLF